MEGIVAESRPVKRVLLSEMEESKTKDTVYVALDTERTGQSVACTPAA